MIKDGKPLHEKQGKNMNKSKGGKKMQAPKDKKVEIIYESDVHNKEDVEDSDGCVVKVCRKKTSRRPLGSVFFQMRF